MRAFLVVSLGLAGAGLFSQAALAKKSTITVHLTPAQVTSICAPFVHSENIGTGPGGYGCSTASTDIRCKKDGQCTITTTTTNAGLPKPFRAGTLGSAASLASAASVSPKTGVTSGNNTFLAGAAQGSIGGIPLKQVGSNAVTASTALTVSPLKTSRSNAVTAASSNLGAAFMPNGRATLRPQ